MKRVLLIAFILLLPTLSLAAEAVTAPVAITVTVTKVNKDPGKLAITLNQNWVMRPSLTVSLMKVNLRDNTISAGVIPGIGYGADYKSIIGLDLYANFQLASTAPPNAIGLSFVVSVIKYISAGIEMGFTDGREPQYSLLLGGSVPLKLQ